MKQPSNIEDANAGNIFASRILKLRQSPVAGKFDETHIKRIHERIFRGFSQSYGGVPFHPGKFREEVKGSGDWSKYRPLETKPGYGLLIVYSRMDAAARSLLRETLTNAKPALLRQLGKEDFIHAIGDIYTKLDYVHPFEEGNSRTLREFTRQLAHASGYELNWERFNQNAAGRDILYIARDLCVDRLALALGIHQQGNERDVRTTLTMFGANRDLPDLLHDAIQPLKSNQLQRPPRPIKQGGWVAVRDVCDPVFMEQCSSIGRQVVKFIAPMMATQKGLADFIERRRPHVMEMVRQEVAERKAAHESPASAPTPPDSRQESNQENTGDTPAPAM